MTQVGMTEVPDSRRLPVLPAMAPVLQPIKAPAAAAAVTAAAEANSAGAHRCTGVAAADGNVSPMPCAQEARKVLANGSGSVSGEKASPPVEACQELEDDISNGLLRAEDLAAVAAQAAAEAEAAEQRSRSKKISRSAAATVWTPPQATPAEEEAENVEHVPAASGVGGTSPGGQLPPGPSFAAAAVVHAGAGGRRRWLTPLKQPADASGAISVPNASGGADGWVEGNGLQLPTVGKLEAAKARRSSAEVAAAAAKLASGVCTKTTEAEAGKTAARDREKAIVPAPDVAEYDEDCGKQQEPAQVMTNAAAGDPVAQAEKAGRGRTGALDSSRAAAAAAAGGKQRASAKNNKGKGKGKPLDDQRTMSPAHVPGVDLTEVQPTAVAGRVGVAAAAAEQAAQGSSSMLAAIAAAAQGRNAPKDSAAAVPATGRGSRQLCGKGRSGTNGQQAALSEAAAQIHVGGQQQQQQQEEHKVTAASAGAGVSAVVAARRKRQQAALVMTESKKQPHPQQDNHPQQQQKQQQQQQHALQQDDDAGEVMALAKQDPAGKASKQLKRSSVGEHPGDPGTVQGSKRNRRSATPPPAAPMTEQLDPSGLEAAHCGTAAGLGNRSSRRRTLPAAAQAQIPPSAPAAAFPAAAGRRAKRAAAAVHPGPEGAAAAGQPPLATPDVGAGAVDDGDDDAAVEAAPRRGRKRQQAPGAAGSSKPGKQQKLNAKQDQQAGTCAAVGAVGKASAGEASAEAPGRQTRGRPGRCQPEPEEQLEHHQEVAAGMAGHTEVGTTPAAARPRRSEPAKKKRQQQQQQQQQHEQQQVPVLTTQPGSWMPSQPVVSQPLTAKIRRSSLKQPKTASSTRLQRAGKETAPPPSDSEGNGEAPAAGTAAAGNTAAATPGAAASRKQRQQHQQQQEQQLPEVLVTLSGMHSDTRQQHAAVLRQLKVRCKGKSDSHDWQQGTTHVVLPSLRRSEKALAAMAAGVWLVREQWVVDSGRAGKLLPVEEYELDECEGAPLTGKAAEF